MVHWWKRKKKGFTGNLKREGKETGKNKDMGRGKGKNLRRSELYFSW